ncbi:MAG: PIN domain-containing protein [Planctomycetes bacterium]|nr:PIN domain-containing protein [Planctomycetota bacterium]
MTELRFVDSNVLVYRHARDETAKRKRADSILGALWRERIGRVSDQVLHEFYVVATRKIARPVAPEVARKEVRLLERWSPIPGSAALRESAWRLEDRFGLSWWDALIVAAAQAAKCRYLLSEDFGDGQDYEGVLVIDPFSRDPAELGLDLRD